MVTPLAFFELIETFPQGGCAVCTMVQKDAAHLLDLLLYERVNERDTHKAFRASRGLCNEHAWQLTGYKGGSLGTAILYRATVDELMKITERHTPDISGKQRTVTASKLASQLEPAAQCMACERLEKTEHDILKIFNKHFSDSRLQEAFAASDGLCLPHFRMALQQHYPPPQLQQVISIQQAIWSRLKAELEEFVDKNRHERMQEEMGREKDSWLRAIHQVSGLRGLFGLQARRGRK